MSAFRGSRWHLLHFWNNLQEAQVEPEEERTRFVFGHKCEIFLSVLHKNKHFGCPLESPSWGDSNEPPQYIILLKDKQNYRFIIIKSALYLLNWSDMYKTKFHIMGFCLRDESNAHIVHDCQAHFVLVIQDMQSN